MAVAAGGYNVSTSIRPRRRTIDRNSQPNSSSISTPFSATAPSASSFDSIPEDHANRQPKPKYTSFSPARFLLGVRLPMFSDVAAGWQSHWLSRLRSALRLLVVVLSGAVIVFLVHTLEIRRGNRYLDLRKGELPMTWPAHTNFYPTLILLLVAVGNFFASIISIALAFRRSFRRPSRSSTAYRVAGHSIVVLIWGGAITAFTLLDKRYRASLGRYACHNQNVMSNGRYQYRAVCEEQGVAFYMAITAAVAELAIAVSLVTSSLFPAKQRIIHYKDDHEKHKRSMSFGVTGRQA